VIVKRPEDLSRPDLSNHIFPNDMKRNYIGLANSFHDGAMAIVDSQGELVFAEATERYLQNKRAINIAPDLYYRTAELIKAYCEPDAELMMSFSWSDRTEQEIQQSRLLNQRSLAQLKSIYGEVPVFMRQYLEAQNFILHSQLKQVVQPGHLLEYQIGQLGAWSRGGSIVRRRYEHHATHAATGCFTSPFEDAVCAVLDGYGEERAFACYAYRNGRLREIEGVQKGNWGSLGFFYVYVCETCGFEQMSGEEWKVMGLAPYGKHDEEIYRLFREMIAVEGLNIVFCSETRLLQILQKLQRLRRRKEQPAIAAADIAYAGQRVFSEVLFQFLNNLYTRGISKNLVLGGGCALNSSATGRILDDTPFENVYVFSAPADDGNAIGAALLAYYEDHPEVRPRRSFQSPYLGSCMDAGTLDKLRCFSAIPKMISCAGQAPQLAAERLAQGKIIGWVQGRAEFGPRALGNRSILADPRSPQVKEAINARVKFREEFRPFAPSILHEFGDEYFEHYQESPYMERTLRFCEAVKGRVPGVVHEGGTGRLQTVKREWNQQYHALISHFHSLTGIPLVLNTSFNVMGKPIAHSVEDALAVFYTSGLDALFIDDLMIEK
jgi:carbamoyltransferase